MRNEMVEAGAQALYECFEHADTYGPWEQLPESMQDVYREEATACLDAGMRAWTEHLVKVQTMNQDEEE